MDRPSNVPDHWLLAKCAGCDGPVWYDPEWEQACIAKGVRFLPVCQTPHGACAMRAILRQPVGSSPACAEASGPGWRVKGETSE